MEVLLAKKELNIKAKKVKVEKLLDSLKANHEEIFYFDKENNHKDMMSIVDKIEDAGYSVHFREVKYGLADDEYIYELHAL